MASKLNNSNLSNVSDTSNKIGVTQAEVKVVFLGMEYCGKTSLIDRFLNDRFTGENSYQNTIGAAYGAKRVYLDDDEKGLLLGLWDTAGSERYEAMSRIYYRGAKAAIVCYDVMNEKSWEKVQFWVDELKRFEESCRIYIVGNKTDLARGNKKNKKIDFHNVLDYAEELSVSESNCIRAYEVSAKTGENVETIFNDISRDYINDPKNTLTEFNRALKLDSDSQNKNFSKCCGLF